MIIRQCLFFILFLFFLGTTSCQLCAQQVKVLSLEETVGDVATAEGKVVDNNGEPCALLKIKMLGAVVNIRSDWMIRFEPHLEKEYWVWLCAGTREVTVTSSQFLPYTIVFSQHNSGIRRLRGGHTYLLNLCFEKEHEQQYGIDITITCKLPQLEIQVDGRGVSLGTVTLDEGKHILSATCDGYEPYIDTLDVNPFIKGQIHTINLVKAIKDYSVYIKTGDHFCETKQYSQAINQYQMAVMHRYGEGFLRMGQMYARGWGVKQDFNEAFGWYLQGSQLGYAPAMNALGELYWYGYGVERDYSRSRSLYLQAIAHGNITAIASLGQLYENGDGVPKNEDSALYFYKKASKQGDAKGLRLLAGTYVDAGKKYGVSMCEQLQEAIPLYLKAAKMGDDIAMATLSILYSEYNCVEKKLNIIERKRVSKQWMEDALEYHHPRVYLWIGDHSGDSKEQIIAYTLAARCGEEEAMNRLGQIYKKAGFAETALLLYRKSASNGNAYAYFKLGEAMRVGSLGFAVNNDSASYYYLKAIAYGISGDAYHSINTYLSYYYKPALAMKAYTIGVEFETGVGGDIDLAKAIKMYRMAANMGSEFAKEALDKLGVSL